MPRLSPNASASIALIIAAGGAMSSSTHGVDIFFADIFNPELTNGSIRLTNQLGTSLLTLVNTGGGLRDLAYDPVELKIYWTDVDNFMIRRANVDGTCVENIITSGLGFPSSIDVDVVGRKIYWGDQADKMQAIWRADLDGSNAEFIISTPFHRGIAIDSANGKMYWSTSTTQFKGDIRRANLDGSDVEVVISSLDEQFKPADIALDIEAGYIYWTDYVVDIVRRSTFTALHPEPLFVPPINHNPRGIALDLVSGHVYWGQDTDIITSNSDLMRMNLDGSNPATVLAGPGLINSIVLLAESAPELCAGDLVDSKTFQPPPDGTVDAADLAYLLGAWGDNLSCADMVTSDTFAPPPDGSVDAADLAYLLGNWGNCTP